jgi:hypothetical protein
MFIARSEYGDYNDHPILCQLANMFLQIAVSSVSPPPHTSSNTVLIPL